MTTQGMMCLASYTLLKSKATPACDTLGENTVQYVSAATHLTAEVCQACPDLGQADIAPGALLRRSAR